MGIRWDVWRQVGMINKMASLHARLSGEELENAMENYSRLTERFEKANGYAWKSEINGVRITSAHFGILSIR